MNTKVVPETILTQELPQAQVNIETASPQNVKNQDGFDPSIHRVDENGNPVMTKTGKFRKKTVSRRVGGEPQNGAAPQGQNPEIGSLQAAQAATQLTGGLGRMIGGTEAEFKKGDGLDEERHIFLAYHSYFVSRGINDFPPGVALTVVLFGYFGRVMLTQRGKSKTERAIGWLKGKFKKYASRNNSRSDRVRENNPSGEEGASVQE